MASRQEREFKVLRKGAAEMALADGLLETNGIFALEMSATVAAVVALGEKLGKKRRSLCGANNAAAGALIKTPTMA